MLRIILLMSFALVAQAQEDYSYHIKAVSFGDSTNIVRYQPATGKAWYVSNDEFVLVKDKSVLPISHYEFDTSASHEIVFDFPPVNSYWQLVRIDTKTGKTWEAVEDQWVEIKN